MIPKTRTFNGKEYKMMASGTTKARIESDAAILRRRGYLVRVVYYDEHKKGILPKYLIYARKGD